LRSGIERSASGRLDRTTVDELVADVEEELRSVGGEVPSDRVGMAVLERLRALDHVAYLRFASVYKGFEDLADFEREVGELQKTTEPKQR
jgi:transcriptional repressor NrdR